LHQNIGLSQIYHDLTLLPDGGSNRPQGEGGCSCSRGDCRLSFISKGQKEEIRTDWNLVYAWNWSRSKVDPQRRQGPLFMPSIFLVSSVVSDIHVLENWVENAVLVVSLSFSSDFECVVA
jgi:hypothetical protein